MWPCSEDAASCQWCNNGCQGIELHLMQKKISQKSETHLFVFGFSQQMRRSGNREENKRITMDLEVVLKSHDCPYIVQCLGCFVTEADVWICMELMATCFDKLLKRLRRPIIEPIIGKIAVAVRPLLYIPFSRRSQLFISCLRRRSKHCTTSRRSTASSTATSNRPTSSWTKEAT